MKWNPHDYQVDAMEFLVERPYSCLFGDPGVGKTSIALGVVAATQRPALVVAPLRVVYGVWRQEAAKWDQFNHLTFSVIHGTEAKRLKAYRAEADVYLTNPENVPWLCELMKKEQPRASTLILDESTKFKNPSARRTVRLKGHVEKFDRRHALTGTPAPNSLMDLWAQLRLVDGGATLGETITPFRHQFFWQGPFHDWRIRRGAAEVIHQLLEPVALRLDADQLLEMPELMINDIPVELPPKATAFYRDLERTMFAELEKAEAEGNLQAVAFDSGSAYNLCRQVAGGAFYTDAKRLEAETVHNAKLEALADVLEALGERPVMIVYWYRHERQRLLEALGEVPAIDALTAVDQLPGICDAWNRGEIPRLLINPLAAGHGLNLQGGGHDQIWLGPIDSLEAYDQTVRRIYRQGVGANVRIHRLIARGTVDQAIAARLDSKAEGQRALLDHLLAYKERTI